MPDEWWRRLLPPELSEGPLEDIGSWLIGGGPPGAPPPRYTAGGVEGILGALAGGAPAGGTRSLIPSILQEIGEALELQLLGPMIIQAAMGGRGEPAGAFGAGGFGGGLQALSAPEPANFLDAIENFGGRASRELVFQDPASFINLLIEEAAGEGVHPLLRQFLIGRGNYLSNLASLVGLSRGVSGETEGMNLMQQIFSEYVTPGAEFTGGLGNVMRLISQVPSQRMPGSEGRRPQEYFDDTFDFVRSVVAPSLPPTMAQALFSNERMVIERALYATAVSRGQFRGNPIDWMVERGFLSRPAGEEAA